MIRNAAAAVAVAVLALTTVGVSPAAACSHSAGPRVGAHHERHHHHARPVKVPRPECPPTFGYAPPRPPGVCR